ncbi:MAG: UDP-3-O-(3-hydroxymyristoyl)glucosamine N-acyltransferase, partial [Methylocystis sp.]|nr:UDP-3-O-(3-hydroxymyristoyl)glucosamine N-acyltransferase [Methylocystis sp.]
MSATNFFHLERPFSLAEIAEIADAHIHGGDRSASVADAVIVGVAPLDHARHGDLSFFDHPRYAAALKACRATACLVRERNLDALPPGVVGLVTTGPYRALAKIMARL